MYNARSLIVAMPFRFIVPLRTGCNQIALPVKINFAFDKPFMVTLVLPNGYTLLLNLFRLIQIDEPI